MATAREITANQIAKLLLPPEVGTYTGIRACSAVGMLEGRGVEIAD